MQRGTVVGRGHALGVVWATIGADLVLMPIARARLPAHRSDVPLDGMPGYRGRAVLAGSPHRVAADGYRQLGTLSPHLARAVSAAVARARADRATAIRWEGERERLAERLAGERSVV